MVLYWKIYHRTICVIMQSIYLLLKNENNSIHETKKVLHLSYKYSSLHSICWLYFNLSLNLYLQQVNLLNDPLLHKNFFPSPQIKDSLGPSFCIFFKSYQFSTSFLLERDNTQCVTVSLSAAWISVLFWIKMCVLLRRTDNYSLTGWLFFFLFLFIIH